jgi:hypothetical protein
LARQLARRQQRERLAGILVVGLGFVVLIVAVVALREPNGHVAGAQSPDRTGPSDVARNSPSGTAPTAASSAPRTSDSPSSVGFRGVPLVVLNDTTTSGLAARAARRFQAAGWTVTRFDNYQNDIVSTCAYYDPTSPGAEAAAQALQRQFPTIKRVEPRFAPDPGAQPLPPGPVVVVLTPDYSAA